MASNSEIDKLAAHLEDLNVSELTKLSFCLRTYIGDFCKKADSTGELYQVFIEIDEKMTETAVVDFALYLMPRLDTFLNLEMAHWASSYANPAIGAYKELYAKETKDEVIRRCKLLEIGYESYEPKVKRWYDEFKTKKSIHATTSVDLIAKIKSLLKQYLPASDRTQAEIDAALSKVGLPTSTESEESWLKRLKETHH